MGEYCTPDWLARAIVREVVTDPLDQYVLGPACGSGTFVAEAVTHFIWVANRTALDPNEVLEWLRFSVSGIDVHPVAVHLARAAWVLAAQPAIQAAVEDGFAANITVPVYLGDALQLRFRAGDIFAEHNVTVQVEDEENTELVFPVSLVDRAETFDALMSDVAEAIERDDDPTLPLDDHGIVDPRERQTLGETIMAMQRLHSEGRNHIWAYYTRNLVRPVVLSRSKVDVIVGNPPWLIYRNTASTLRHELERQSKDVYGIWVGGRHANHQDISSLFFARCVDLYLRNGGVIGMVMPHSALQTGQHSKWRTGAWQAKPKGRGRNRTPGRTLAVAFNQKTAWDLEGLEPNTFFPVPASVVFARANGEGGKAAPLEGEVERWLGNAGADNVRRERMSIVDTSVDGNSPYAGLSRQGAVIVPRCLFFVEETENPAIVQAGQTITVNPRRGSQDKEPWKSLDLTAISEQTVEVTHVFDIHLGETVVPYATLAPLRAVLPLRRGEHEMPTGENGVGGIRLGGLGQRMRDRWRMANNLWEANRAVATKLDLLGQLDYYGKLSSQLEWSRAPGLRQVRVVYGGWGTPTAALLHDDDAIVDYKLFWIACKDTMEANYLLAIINSDALAVAVNRYTTPNWAAIHATCKSTSGSCPYRSSTQRSHGPAQVLHRPVALAHRHVGQSPVVVSVGVAGGQGDGHVEVAHRPRKVAQLRLARPPAVVRHDVAWGQADGGGVVLHRRAVLLQLGVGAGSVEVGARIVGFEGDDPAVVLRRKAVLPQLAVCQPPGGQGFGVVRVRPDRVCEMLDHPEKALAAHAVHHPAELEVVFGWLPLIHPVMLPGHDAPPVCLDVPLSGRFIVAEMVAWDGADSGPWAWTAVRLIGGSPARAPRRACTLAASLFRCGLYSVPLQDGRE